MGLRGIDRFYLVEGTKCIPGIPWITGLVPHFAALHAGYVAPSFPRRRESKFSDISIRNDKLEPRCDQRKSLWDAGMTGSIGVMKFQTPHGIDVLLQTPSLTV